MLARRLLIVGAAGFTVITPTPIAATTAPKGSTQPISGSSAYQYNGVIYIAYIDGSNGNVEIVTMSDATGIVSSPFVLHAAMEADWHDVPTVLVRSDGRIVVAYSRHVGAQMYIRISTNAEDITAWDAETNVDSQISGLGNYTYPSLWQLTGESGSPIYLWYRQQLSGTDTQWCLAKSTTGGVSFAAQVVVFKITPTKDVYARVDSDGTRLDFAVTNGTGTTDHASLFHAYRAGTSYFKSDGTSAGSLPIDPNTLTQIYDGSATGVRYPASIKGNGGSPIVTFPDMDGGPESYYWSIYSGGSWHNHLVTDDGATGAAWVEGGFVLDLGDSTYSYLSRSAGGHYSVSRFHTTDSGATFDSALLATSPSDDFYPIAIRNPLTRKVIWSRGTASAYTTFSLGLMAS